MKIQFLAFLAVFIFFVSCNEDSDPVEKTASYDVYVGGVDNFKAAYWKNGQQTFVQGGDNLMGTQIIVDHNDVYLFGTNIEKIDPTPAWYFWKNGVKHNIAQYLNSTNDSHFSILGKMEVHNGDIYFLGTATNPSPASSQDLYQYCYWKNGVKTVLETYGQGNSIMPGGGIKVYNNDIYVAVRKNFSYFPVPSWDLGYYKNGNYHLLASTGTIVPHSFINDPSNPSQFYMLTGNADTPTNPSNPNDISSVKNITSGSDIQVPANILQSNITDMRFEGSDKYYIGKKFYYKNSNLVQLNDPAGFNSIGHFEVKDQNIYMTRLNLDQNSVKFYINDVETLSLSDITKGCFNSIFVVKKN